MVVQNCTTAAKLAQIAVTEKTAVTETGKIGARMPPIVVMVRAVGQAVEAYLSSFAYFGLVVGQQGFRNCSDSVRVDSSSQLVRNHQNHLVFVFRVSYLSHS